MDIKKDHARLLSNLRIVQKQYTADKLCKLLGISNATWTNRMKEPWRYFSYDDLRQISRYAKIDFITLVDGEVKIC